ncbi:hypothetical protein L202_07890 [Cryptococcus amylolentus CBS 6039]|uniref:Myb/SANT-like domain-containing protein n=1 Tax=Cryptococcus amylolentus CBS 6039 TaxID=1295533 RepID=A0A1E3HAH9_9TREE|nr:hypothetical protein L202_07890 [Cryptococcus amylolentus CBS 6039]ODN73348.1 hypothetical protein L202_07890 [Cryptococcus amylolentus CBS 6039]
MSVPQHPPPSPPKHQPATKKKKTQKTTNPDVASVTPATASPTPGAPGTPGVAAAASTQDWSNKETLVMLRELVDRRLWILGAKVVHQDLAEEDSGTVLRTDKSLKGKINTLRKDYKLIATLLNDSSGFGWNDELKCVCHEDDFW